MKTIKSKIPRFQDLPSILDDIFKTKKSPMIAISLFLCFYFIFVFLFYMILFCILFISRNFLLTFSFYAKVDVLQIKLVIKPSSNLQLVLLNR